MLPTIYEWSIQHIKNVFEAKSEDECIRALDGTFSQNIDFITNGKQHSRADLQRFVLTMVTTSGFRLKVQWQNALEVPRDSSNRVRMSSLRASYVRLAETRRLTEWCSGRILYH